MCCPQTSMTRRPNPSAPATRHIGDASVHPRPRHLWIFFPEFEHTRPRLKVGLEPMRKICGLRSVIPVNHDREIDRVGRQLRNRHQAAPGHVARPYDRIRRFEQANHAM